MILQSDIHGIKIYELPKYSDDRGKLFSSYKDTFFPNKFKEDRFSYSHKGVLRGLHGDKKTDKLFFLVRGKIRFAGVCYNKSNSNYGRTVSFLLNDSAPKLIYLPAYYLNGHLALEDTILMYKWTEYYDGPDNQETVKYNDEFLQFPWEIETPILSNRDQQGSNFLNL